MSDDLIEQSDTDDLIEQAAKAHYEASHDMRVDVAWADCHPMYRAQKVGAMRTAIATLKVPTVDMIVNATEEWTCVRAFEDRAEVIWDAMIDTLLGYPRASAVKVA